MRYLSDVLGVKVKYYDWEKEKQIPYFILDKYRIELVSLDQTKILFLYPRYSLENISAIKKHILRIQKVEKLPLVFVLDKISRYRRQSFIEARIPFIVVKNQIYLPFLGTVLQEKFEAEDEVVEKFQPSAQLLLLHYIYQNKKQLYTSEVVSQFGFSAMTITRATKQLESTGLFETKKNGVKKVLEAEFAGKTLFEKAKKIFDNPIRKIFFFQIEDVIPEMFESGYTALANKSMLNKPELQSYAIYGDKWKGLQVTEKLIDSDKQARLEVWKYDPSILSKDKVVDTLSLAISLKNDRDERVEQMIEEMLDTLWEDLDGRRI